MTPIREFAPAKINLTLEVAGRRGDGFHELASLVAFADVGDVVVLDTEGGSGVSVSGPFAGQLDGVNILATALALLAERAPQLSLGSVNLEKHLPVAAGIGGGSADAGALLRAVRRANGSVSDDVNWRGLARELGADVPVCLEARPLWMTGIGDALAEIAGGLPSLEAVLINPMAMVPGDKTARVFRALGAASLGASYSSPPSPYFHDRDALLAFMRARGNDLLRAAQAVVSEVGAALDALQSAERIEYAAVSGAGPTCFGIFSDRGAAEAARQRITATRPTWWAVAARLGSSPPPAATRTS
jgi:4-diphosphocytidyl-2-C-methyl-D-erythritol kinase